MGFALYFGGYSWIYVVIQSINPTLILINPSMYRPWPLVQLSWAQWPWALACEPLYEWVCVWTTESLFLFSRSSWIIKPKPRQLYILEYYLHWAAFDISFHVFWTLSLTLYLGVSMLIASPKTLTESLKVSHVQLVSKPTVVSFGPSRRILDQVQIRKAVNKHQNGGNN